MANGDPCGPTGVAVQTTQMVDLGMLTDKAQVSVDLKRGDSLFVGASDCGTYKAPPASAVKPVLQQTQVGRGGFLVLAVWYSAATAGQVTLVYDCNGRCRFGEYRVVVTVS